jgi:hypothetical protein
MVGVSVLRVVVAVGQPVTISKSAHAMARVPARRVKTELYIDLISFEPYEGNPMRPCLDISTFATLQSRSSTTKLLDLDAVIVLSTGYYHQGMNLRNLVHFYDHKKKSVKKRLREVQIC